MQSRLSVDALLELMYQGSLETLYMVGVAAVFTLLLAGPHAVGRAWLKFIRVWLTLGLWLLLLMR